MRGLGRGYFDLSSFLLDPSFQMTTQAALWGAHREGMGASEWKSLQSGLLVSLTSGHLQPPSSWVLFDAREPGATWVHLLPLGPASRWCPLSARTGRTHSALSLLLWPRLSPFRPSGPSCYQALEGVQAEVGSERGGLCRVSHCLTPVPSQVPSLHHQPRLLKRTLN